MRLPWLLLALGCGGSGRFDHDRFDDLVARVRPLVTQPDRVLRFRLADDLDPRSLAALPETARLGRGDGRGLVNAVVDSRHHLAVSIETRDDGHAGEYGFMYVDDGFDPADLEYVQRDSQHEERIDDRWRRWHYDLD